MDLKHYLMSGHAYLFVETNEINRAMRSIKTSTDHAVHYWNANLGISTVLKENGQDCDHLQVLEFAKMNENRLILLENYDTLLENFVVMQSMLNVHQHLKANQTCLVIVGSNPKRIPPQLKEFIPVIEFKLPNKQEIETIVKETREQLIEAANEDLKNGIITQEERDKLTFDYDNGFIGACMGLSHEEIENTISYSAISDREFNTRKIIEKKGQILKQTGFMQYIHPEPLENLGGVEKYKEYMLSRLEPFKNPESIKPKLKAVLIAGLPGSGKSLSAKVACSIFNWPGILLDLGALKGSLVGETEANTRKATQTIDAQGRCIIILEELEKIFGGSGHGDKHSTDEAMLNHFLTWMQERPAGGAIIIATANRPDILPAEMLRTGGRWDSLFFFDLPNPLEIKHIVEIKNRQFHSNLPTDNGFCETLWEEKWSGAEIEQLAKDIHYESDLKTAMKQIPILAKHQQKNLDAMKEKTFMFRKANSSVSAKDKLQALKNKNAGIRKLKLK